MNILCEKKALFAFLTVLALLTGISPVWATHLMGGSLSYEYQGFSGGKYVYELTLKVYNNCGTTSNVPNVQESVEIGIYAEDAAFPNSDKTLIRAKTLFVTDSSVVEAQLTSNCTIGTGICIKEGIFVDTIQVPFSSDGYHIAYQRCCRNGDIDNLDNPGDAAMIFHAFIVPQSNSPPNSTPALDTLSVPYLCAGDTTTLLNIAQDPDGDSLVFGFAVPLNGMASTFDPSPGATATLDWPVSTTSYATGFSLSQPFGSGGQAFIDPATGVTQFYAPLQGFYVVTIEIREYRNGFLISSTRRDIQLLVIQCPFNPPPNLSAQGGSGQTNFSIFEGDTLCFPVTFTDANGDSIFLESDAPIFDPGQTNPPATLPDAAGDSIVTSQFCWNTTCGQAGFYQFVVNAKDNGCPPKTEPELYSINVLPYIAPDTITGPETVCSNQNITYTANNSVTFMDWIVIGGTVQSSPSNSVIVNWPDTTTLGTIILAPKSGQNCLVDSVFKYVNVIAGPSANVQGDTAICAYESVFIGDNPVGGYVYNWSPSIYLSSPTIANPEVTPSHIAVDTTIFYVLTVTNGGICSASDSVEVTINPKPEDFIMGPDSVCSRATVTYTVGNASGANLNWSITGGQIVNTQPTFVDVEWHDTTQTGTISISPVSASGCQGDVSSITVTVTETPIAFAGPDTAFCSQNAVFLGGPGDPAFTYRWVPSDYLNDSTLSNPQLLAGSPTQADTLNYVLTVTNNSLCPVYDTVEVILFPVPDLKNILGSRYVCPGITGVKYWLNENTPGSVYDWVIEGGVLASGQGTDTITVDWGGTGIGLVKMVETTNMGCVGDTVWMDVNINPLLEPQIPEGPEELCVKNRDSVEYTTFYTNGSSYTWFVNNGTVIAGQGSPNVLITWDSVSATTTGMLWVEEHVIADTICSGVSDTLYITIHPSPVTSPINGDLSVCEEDEDVLYYVNGDAGSDYHWDVTGGKFTSQKNNDSVRITWTKDGTHLLYVVEENVNGCFGDTVSVNVVVAPKPATSSIQGAIFVCAPDFSDQSYSVTGFDGPTFEWILNGGTITQGDGTDSVVIDWAQQEEANIAVIETSSSGCVGDTVDLEINFDLPFIEMRLVTDDYDNDKNVMIYWDLYNGQFFKGFFHLYRKELDRDTLWTYLGNTDTTYWMDEKQPTSEKSLEYRVEMLNQCDDTVISNQHNSILLEGTNEEFTKEVFLDWNDYKNWKQGVQTYEVFRKLDHEADYSLYADAMTATATEFVNGKDGFRHCYRVRAIENISGEESWSNELCLDFRHEVIIPEAFSPNGDGVNDVWYIENIEMFPNNHVQIFNRWGNMVYEADSYDNSWDGRRKGKKMPDATYYFVVDLKNSRRPFTGAVTIIR